MVPTSYTVEEYIDYLRNEVLLESAESLGWPDLVESEVSLPEVKTVSAHTDSTITVSALLKFVPFGSTLTFEDGYMRMVSQAAAVGATTIHFSPDFDTENPNGKKVLIKYSTDRTQVPNPKFRAVVDEALRQIGLENIELVDITNVRLFRIVGRLELLRRILENRVSLYDQRTVWIDEDNNFVQRELVSTPSITTNQLLTLYSREIEAFRKELAPTLEVEVPEVNISIPSLSQSQGVSIRW